MLTVGHNDAGYPPDAPPAQVPSLNEAICLLKQMIELYFSVEIDPEGIDLTVQDIRRWQSLVFNAKPGSTMIFRGHAFWIQ